MSIFNHSEVTPRIEVIFNFVYNNEHVKKVSVREKQLVKNLVYVQNGEEKTVSGVVDVINFISKAATSNSNGCIHDEDTIFDKYVSVTNLIIDCSDKYSCNVVSVPSKSIIDIESVEDIIPNVVRVGDEAYTDFAEALTSVESGSTIILTETVQCEEKLTISEGKEVVINLNGNKLLVPSVENNYGMIVKGDLTFDGAGDVVTGFYGIGVPAKGKLTIDSGSFKCTENGDYLIGSWGETIINGGEFHGNYCCVNGFEGTVIINGGNFVAESAVNDPEWGWTVILGNVKVTGGTFNHPVAERYCAEGYVPKSNNNGTYTVEKVSE